MGEPSFQAQQWYSDRDLAKMLQDCSDDDIKLFVKNISADYTRLDAVYKDVKNMVKVCLPEATVEARGSYRSKTALKEGADLDIDLVLPNDDMIKGVHVDDYHEVVSQIADILESKFGEPKNRQSITRRLEYKVQNIEIDMFIKCLQIVPANPQSHLQEPTKQKSNLISVSKNLVFYQIREQTHEDFGESDEVAQAVVMLLKWWKKKHCSHLKSYHILLPIGRVPVRNPRHISFKRRVIQSMIDVIAFLSEGYTIRYEAGNYGSDSKFSFDDISNPFRSDVSEQEKRNEISAKLRRLWLSLVDVEKGLTKTESADGKTLKAESSDGNTVKAESSDGNTVRMEIM